MSNAGRAIEDLRWGVLGTAGIARTAIAGLRAAGAGRVEAVASRDAAKGRAWADELGIPLCATQRNGRFAVRLVGRSTIS